MTTDQNEDLLWLADYDYVFLDCAENDESNCVAFVLCNDTFGYASADCEPILHEDMPMVASLLKTLAIKYGYDGIVAWVAFERQREPLAEYRTFKYCSAMAWLQRKWDNGEVR